MSSNNLNHISFIMDGNQRWAKKNNLNSKQGYIKGLNKINEIVDFCISHQIKNLTIYALSAENYKRNKVSIIFNIIKDEYKNFLDKINKKKLVKIKIIGKKNNLSENIKEIFENIERKTINNNTLNLNIVFNYGIFDEIEEIFLNLKKNNQHPNEKNIRSAMLLNNIPDPDILIRTGGYSRLSNFILLNLAYTELFFTDTFWPDFSIRELANIISKFKLIKRNYGL